MSALGYAVRGSTLTLDAATTSVWESDGPEADAVRRELRRDARRIGETIVASGCVLVVEVCSADGVVLDAIEVRS